MLIPPPLQRVRCAGLLDRPHRAVKRVDDSGTIDGSTHEAIAPPTRSSSMTVSCSPPTSVVTGTVP